MPLAATRAALPMKAWIRKAKRMLRRPGLVLLDRPVFTCPICRYRGKFFDKKRSHGTRRNAMCPRCGALERHRLQICVLNDLFASWDPTGRAALHFAPEPELSRYLAKRFARYTTTDIAAGGVDVPADIRDLPFPDASYDFVFASHVLEHVDDDRKALSELARILRPDGIAVLSVPVLGDTTVEYPYPVPTETFHVRAPGIDYSERYRALFREVVEKSSADYPAAYQLYSYEDRTVYPTEACPFRVPTPGERHAEYVSICRR